MSDYLTPKQAAEELHISDSTLKLWRRNGTGPPCFKNQGKILYSKEKLDNWIEGHTGS